ncbi:MAG: LacI family DNA-binding transcriptional regulator [Victivallales bacterium]
MLSIKEISLKTGYSTATISRVFDPRHSHKVKEGTKTKIVSVCEELNYQPKLSAKALASGKTFTIGLILAAIERDFASLFAAEVISALTRELRSCNYNLTLLAVPDDSPEIVDREVLKTFHSSAVDGFVLGAGVIGQGTLAELSGKNFPVVAISLPSSIVPNNSISHVYVNNMTGTKELANHLIKLGHRKIAYLKQEDNYNLRSELFLQCIREAGGDFNDGDLIRLQTVKRDNFQAIYSAYSAGLENWEKIKKYSAFVCGNDFLALGLTEAVKCKGMKPGKDVSIAGYDNVEENVNFSVDRPFLTTIAPPRCQLGIEAGKLIMGLISKKVARPAKLELQSKLIIRESTGGLMG